MRSEVQSNHIHHFLNYPVNYGRGKIFVCWAWLIGVRLQDLLDSSSVVFCREKIHMSKKDTLKTELTILEQQFPKNHDCVQVITSSREELILRFVNKDQKYTMHCNISVSDV